MKYLTLLLICVHLFNSCGFLEEEEPEILLSQVDGEQYMEDMKSEVNSRKDTRLIEEGKFVEVGYESLLNLADSLTSKNDEWRPRYFEALNAHLFESNFNIDEKDNQRFGIGIFNYFLFYPNEFIDKMNASEISQIDFWDNQLSMEIHRKEKLDGITSEAIISLAQENCTDCSAERKDLIANMVRTFLMD